MSGTLFYLLCSIASISAGLPAISRSMSDKCPPRDSYRPCDCRRFINFDLLSYINADHTIICEEVIYNVESLKALISGLPILKGSEPIRLALRNVFLRYLPEDLFVETNVKSLFLHNSRISSLSDGKHPLKGLENVLETLSVCNCIDANRWDLTQLKRLKKLKCLEIERSNLEELSEDFLDVASEWNLETLSFMGNNIEELPPKAFSKFEQLGYLNMGNNSLKSVKRSLFPNPAPKLRQLSLSENKIRYLPCDIFTGMPWLRAVALFGNPITVLDEQTFKPVWSQLKVINLGDALHCDCRMAWISWTRRYYENTFKAACKTPERLREKNLKDLKREDFKC